MRRSQWLSGLMAAVVCGSPAASADGPRSLRGVNRVVVLGDSNTYAGRWVEYVEAFLRAKDPALRSEFLNLGLPSETVSGLTEPGHAGGAFPRPDLHERLDRVLDQTRPDMVVACYGMNDGIYYPFARDRFEMFQDGMRRLRAKVMATGAKFVVVTPPVFDPVPIRSKTLPAGRDEYTQPYEGYDEVLSRYSDWLLGLKAEGWEVVDSHGPMRRLLEERRKNAPAFTMARDGVHFDDNGHWLTARALLGYFGTPANETDAASGEDALSRLPHGRDVLALVSERQRVLKDAWLTATGHKRPGVPRGVPLNQARQKAADIENRLRTVQGIRTP